MKLDGGSGYRVKTQRDGDIDETRAIDGGFEVAYEDAPVVFLLLQETFRRAAERTGIEYE